MEYKNLLIEKEGFIAVVTINRPKVLNALNDETIAELKSCFEDLEKEDGIRAVILTGAGEKSFVAGADIGELKEQDREGGVKRSLRGQGVLLKIENLPKPVIAAVNGYALGGGCELAMACDIRIASEKAKMGQPEVNLGIIPGYGGTQRLTRLVGMGKAKELIFTGSIISAQEAHRIGLVDQIAPPDQLMETAMKMANAVAGKGPIAIANAKKAINVSLDMDMIKGGEIEAKEFGALCDTEDMQEGMSAFFEKREPDFKGK
jgi:enoyl-CoA hydratase